MNIYLEILQIIRTSLQKYIIQDIVDIIIYEYYLPKNIRTCRLNVHSYDSEEFLEIYKSKNEISLEKVKDFYNNIKYLYLHTFNLDQPVKQGTFRSTGTIIGRLNNNIFFRFYYNIIDNRFGELTDHIKLYASRNLTDLLKP
jgi:hypothetical protein